MANKVLLKKSSVGARAPVVGDLDYGELALNYADGKLYYKTSSNTIDSIPSVSATATLTNKTLSAATLTSTLTAGGGVGTSGQVLQSTGTGVQWSNAGSGDVTLTGTQTLTNKTLSSVVLTGTVAAGGGTGSSGQVLSSTGSGVQWVDQTGGGGSSGYNNSSLSAFPSGNYNGTDTYIGESGSAFDAFGVSLLATFTCMDPVGSTQTTDLGVLT
jgi:hypothetical protein